MKIRNTSEESDKIELQMTPMIDIVFQLLVFFVMTFKIVSMEADFNIKMPRSAPSQGMPLPDVPALKLTLRANSEGVLSSIQVGNRSLTGNSAFNELSTYILERFGGASGPDSPDNGAEVELEFDANLKYEWIVRAMDAISGYRDPTTGEVVRLVEKIKFSPPRGAPSG